MNRRFTLLLLASAASIGHAPSTLAQSETTAPGDPGPGVELATNSAEGLSPNLWGAEELAALREIDFRWNEPPVGASGTGGVIATTSFGGTATRVGLEALRQGGSAVDAALAAALVQSVLNLGSWTSFAGTLSMVTFDAASGEVHTLDGGWNTVLGETRPETIPGPGSTESPGRRVLVPGFMAGVQAAHDRFGRLPFEELFQPAIFFAENGFELHPGHRMLLESRRDVVTRLPEGQGIFLREDGELYEPGELFTQPQLAATLRAVAREGADYMYRGAWARKLVEAVQRQGGKLEARDLEAYRPAWRPPARGAFGQYEVAGQGLPMPGGAEVVQAFHLLELAGLDPSSHYTQSAEEFERMIRVAHASLLFLGDESEFLGELFGDLDLSAWGRTRPEVNLQLWEQMSSATWLESLEQAEASRSESAGHSDAIVVADAEGNVVALLHTINTSLWGSTGIFVDGVSVSDAGGIQQRAVAAAGAGHRLLDSGHPFLVLEDGRPVAASASVGRGLHLTAVQHVANLLHYGMSPLESVGTPQFLGPFIQTSDPGSRPLTSERVYAGSIAEPVLSQLRSLGRDVREIEPQVRRAIGYWAGLKIDRLSGLVEAAASADGYAAALEASASSQGQPSD